MKKASGAGGGWGQEGWGGRKVLRQVSSFLVPVGYRVVSQGLSSCRQSIGSDNDYDDKTALSVASPGAAKVQTYMPVGSEGHGASADGGPAAAAAVLL